MEEIRVLFVLTLSWTFAHSLQLPDYITPCHRYDPKINECALKSARATIPHVVNGDPKYRVPPLDPVIIKELKVQQGSSSIGLTFAAHDAYLRGLKDVDIREVKFEFEKTRMLLDLYFPKLHVDFIYNVTGKVLLLPIEGYGNGTIDLDKVKADYSLDWEVRKKKDGKDYAIPIKSKLNFEPEKFRINLKNLFNGNKLLGDNMNNFMNENWRDILKDVGPALSEAMGQYMQQILNNIFQLVPNENVFIYDSV